MDTSDDTNRLSTALGDLLPHGVVHSAGVIPERADFEFKIEKDFLQTAGDYRKREFAAGRDCVRTALEKLGFDRCPILPDSYGVPVWPHGARAVLSHSRGYCAAIAARATQYQALGVDLEKTNRLSAAAVQRTVHPNEQAYVQEDQTKASLFFCAKEAFFKAQFPIWQTHANFHDLELSVDEEAGRMTVKNIDARFPEELRSLIQDFEFRFSYFGDFVVSACWLRQPS